MIGKSSLCNAARVTPLRRDEDEDVSCDPFDTKAHSLPIILLRIVVLYVLV